MKKNLPCIPPSIPYFDMMHAGGEEISKGVLAEVMIKIWKDMERTKRETNHGSEDKVRHIKEEKK